MSDKKYCKKHNLKVKKVLTSEYINGIIIKRCERATLYRLITKIDV